MYALNDGDNDAKVSAIVSIHGGLGDHIWDHRNTTAATEIDTASMEDRPQVLVLSGGSDDTATDITMLEDTMDNATLEWEITRYSGIGHAFTVFGGGCVR
jgi:hypothetical protein